MLNAKNLGKPRISLCRRRIQLRVPEMPPLLLDLHESKLVRAVQWVWI